MFWLVNVAVIFLGFPWHSVQCLKFTCITCTYALCLWALLQLCYVHVE